MRSLSDALHPARRWMVMLAIVEYALLVGAFYLAAWIRFFGNEQLQRLAFGDVLQRALVFASVLVVSMTAFGMYVMHSREGLNGHAVRAIAASIAGGSVLIVAQYVMPLSTIGRGVLALALGIGLVIILTSRAILLRVLREELLQRKVLVLGTGERAAQIHVRMRRVSDRHTFRVMGYVACGDEASVIPEDLQLSTPEGLVDLVTRLEIEEIVVAMDVARAGEAMDELMQCRMLGVTVNDICNFIENETGRIQLDVVNPSWLVFAEGFDTGAFRTTIKRIFDILASGGLLILASPIMALTALAILIESGLRAPILYRQERVGLGGRSFDVIKFRSMRTDAEKDGIARWASTDDDRVTRVGRVIRKLRIDELPQVWNVLRGDMSFVGPRPERPTFVKQLEQQIPYYGLRHAVKPGITGWAQLKYAYGASVKDAEEKLKFDLYYVKNHSFMFDLLTLLQTVEVVVFGKGAR